MVTTPADLVGLWICTVGVCLLIMGVFVGVDAIARWWMK
jgi:hypothetical protein